MSAVLNLDVLEAQVSEQLVRSIRDAATTKKWFDITAFNPLDKLFDDKAEGAARISREFKLLHRLHCQNFEGMPQEVRDAIPALVEAVIEIARKNFDERRAQA